MVLANAATLQPMGEDRRDVANLLLPQLPHLELEGQQRSELQMVSRTADEKIIHVCETVSLTTAVERPDESVLYSLPATDEEEGALHRETTMDTCW